jgi:hypothetical protein
MRASPHRSLVLAALLGATTGCATLIRGSTTLVTVRSDAPGAEVVVDGEARGTTPLTLPLEHRSSHHIVVRYGALARAFRLESSVDPGWIVLDLFLTSLVGVVVDSVTGAWSSLSQDDVVASFGDAALLSATLPAASMPAPPPGAVAPVAPWTVPDAP